MGAALPAPLRPLPGGPGGWLPAERVERRLRELGTEPIAWSNGPGDRYGVHSHSYTKLLVCVGGSITFLVGRKQEPVELDPGAGFVLPPRTDHAAIVGGSGCTCIEGHLAGQPEVDGPRTR